MIYNKKLKVETDEQNLAVQKKIVEELGNAWIVYLDDGYVSDFFVITNSNLMVCVSRKDYRHFLIDSFGNLVFCDKEMYDKSHNEEISLKDLGIEDEPTTLWDKRTAPCNLLKEGFSERAVKEALKEFLDRIKDYPKSRDGEIMIYPDDLDAIAEDCFGKEMLE